MNFEDLLRRAKEGERKLSSRSIGCTGRFLLRTPWNLGYLMKICTRNCVQHSCSASGCSPYKKFFVDKL